MIVGLIDETVKRYIPPESVEEQWDVPGLEAALASEFQMQLPVGQSLKDDPDITDDKLRDRLSEAALAQYASKEAQVGPDLMRQFERSLMLQTLDQHWRDHLANLDHLRQGIHLRGYAQKNPKQEYKRESFELFSDMLDRIKQDVVRVVLTVQVRTPEDVQAVEEKPAVNVRYQHADYDEALANEEGADAAGGAGAAVATAPFVRVAEKVGRNDPLPLRVRQEVQALPRPVGVKLLRRPSASSHPRHARPLHAAAPRRTAAGEGRHDRDGAREDQELAARRSPARRVRRRSRGGRRLHAEPVCRGTRRGLSPPSR